MDIYTRTGTALCVKMHMCAGNACNTVSETRMHVYSKDGMHPEGQAYNSCNFRFYCFISQQGNINCFQPILNLWDSIFTEFLLSFK